MAAKEEWIKLNSVDGSIRFRDFEIGWNAAWKAAEEKFNSALRQPTGDKSEAAHISPLANMEKCPNCGYPWNQNKCYVCGKSA